MQYIDEEMLALLKDTTGIHWLPKPEFAQLIKKRPYQEMQSKKTIFLDLKYWITFRMIFSDENISRNLSTAQIDSYKQIYDKLSQLTKSEKITCVLSDSILTELEKMPLERRLKTAGILDSLQTTIVLNGLNTCSEEIVNIYRIAEGQPPSSNYHLSSVFEANRFLTAITLGKFEHEPDVIHNILYDEMSRSSVTKYLRESDGDFHDSSQKFAELFNENKTNDTRSYTYQDLLIKGLGTQERSLKEIIGFHPEAKINIADHLDSYQKNAPFLYLHSAIHAAMGMDKARKIHSNDFYDLSHSCMGIGYADYFFTEKKFHHLLKSKPINATAIYKCSIHSDTAEIVKILEQI